MTNADKARSTRKAGAARRPGRGWPLGTPGVTHEPSTWILDQVKILERAFADLATLDACTNVRAGIEAWQRAHPGETLRPTDIPGMHAAAWAPGTAVCADCWQSGELWPDEPCWCDRCGGTGAAICAIPWPPYTFHVVFCGACQEREWPTRTDLRDVSGELCAATANTTGRPCKNRHLPGGTFCRQHTTGTTRR